MSAYTGRRTTACISEAFDFLNDSEFTEDFVVRNNNLMKKSVSDTGLVNLERSGFNSGKLLRGNGVLSTYVRGSQNISELGKDDISLGDNSTGRTNDFTIVTYLDDVTDGKQKGRENNHSDSGFIQESSFEGDVSENNAEFTIVSYIDSDQEQNETDANSKRTIRDDVISNGCDSGIVTNDGENRKSDTTADDTEDCNVGFSSGIYKDDQVILRNKSNILKVSDSMEGVTISEKEVNSYNDISVDEASLVVQEEESVIRRRSKHTEEKQSRRTQQIVSDAFSFLKDDYSQEDDDRISAIQVDDKQSIIVSDSTPGKPSRRTQRIVSDAFSFLKDEVGQDDDERISAIRVNDEQSVIQQQNQNHNNKGEGNNCNANLTRKESQNSDRLSESEAIPSMSPERLYGGSTGRRVLKKQKNQTSISGDSDDSSDDDTGVYNESFRNSVWVCVSNNDQQSLSSVSTIPEENESETIQPEGKQLERQPTDEVFDNGRESPRLSKMHKRSESTTSTQSEAEFKREYRLRRKCVVQRHDSQQEYHRMSAKFYDQEKVVLIEKGPDETDFGIHILDSHPAIITGVDPGSPADRAGIHEKQILISVNWVNVLESSHPEIVALVQQKPSHVRLEVAASDVYHIRDQQTSTMTGYIYKLSTSAFVKNWKKRYMVLRHDSCLYFYKNEQEQDPLGALPLLNYLVSRYIDSNKENCFKAEKYGAKTYYFMAETREDMARWVGAMNEAAQNAKKRRDAWMDVTSHNVGLPALEIRKPDCSGYLSKCGRTMKTWKRRYCVLKDACIYYFKTMNSQSAQGMAHLHGYTVVESGVAGKRNSFLLQPPEPQMRSFSFYADNETDKIRWITALNKSIKRWIKVD